MNCKICQNQAVEIFSGVLLGKHQIGYFHCQSCGFLQTEEPFWLEEAYAKPINKTDTGYIKRNISLSKISFFVLPILFNKKGKFLDYAGGYGTFTRIMRDYGLDFYWDDLHTKNLFAEGFEGKEKSYEALTSFECFEHLINPQNEIQKMLQLSRNILFTTILIPDNPPNINEWWYYGLEHGQHISFYSMKTLKFIAEKYNLNLYSNGKNVHLFTKKKISNFAFQLALALGLLPFDLNILSQIFLKTKTMADHDYLIRK